MRKFLLLFSCSLVTAGVAQALSPAEQMNAMRDILAAEFQKIDENNDGVVNMEEFLKHQFSELRRAVSQSEGFELPEPEKNNVSLADTAAKPDNSKEPPVSAPAAPTSEDAVREKGLDALSTVSLTLQAMADYDEDLDDGYDYDALLAEDVSSPVKPSEESTAAEIEDPVSTSSETEAAPTEEKTVEVPEIDLSISEEEALKNMLEEKEVVPVPQKTEAEKEAHAKQIKFMLDTIKKTLPKKVDDITTWTDIEYQDNAIAYIYQADVDTSKFSAAEKNSLKKSIETIACTQAYGQMCPKAKVMFINEGVNMRIRYLDKVQNEISFCEFNEQTCP